MGGLDELKVWEVVGEGSAAFCPFAEKVSGYRTVTSVISEEEVIK